MLVRIVRLLSVVVALALGAIAGACTDSDSDGRPEVGSTGFVEQLPRLLGCGALSDPEPTGLFIVGSTREFCAVDGRRVAVVHRFEPEDRGRAIRRASARVDRQFLNPCPDGPLPPGPWIVVGDDWAVSSYDEPLLRRVAAELGGDFVGGGADGEPPPVGPPASFEMLNACAP